MHLGLPGQIYSREIMLDTFRRPTRRLISVKKLVSRH